MSTTKHRCYDMEIYSMVDDLTKEGFDVEAARDRLHNEVDEAVEYYIGKQEEDEQ